jgi:hypothetical protein
MRLFQGAILFRLRGMADPPSLGEYTCCVGYRPDRVIYGALRSNGCLNAPQTVPTLGS